MTPNSFKQSIAADEFETLVENAIVRAQDLYDLDGETFFRNRNGCIETGSWEADQ